jgi:hypothetical protein
MGLPSVNLNDRALIAPVNPAGFEADHNSARNETGLELRSRDHAVLPGRGLRDQQLVSSTYRTRSDRRRLFSPARRIASAMRALLARVADAAKGQLR